METTRAGAFLPIASRFVDEGSKKRAAFNMQPVNHDHYSENGHFVLPVGAKRLLSRVAPPPLEVFVFVAFCNQRIIGRLGGLRQACIRV